MLYIYIYGNSGRRRAITVALVTSALHPWGTNNHRWTCSVFRSEGSNGRHWTTRSTRPGRLPRTDRAYRCYRATGSCRQSRVTRRSGEAWSQGRAWIARKNWCYWGNR